MAHLFRTIKDLTFYFHISQARVRFDCDLAAPELRDGTRSFIRARKFQHKKPQPELASSTAPGDSLV